MLGSKLGHLLVAEEGLQGDFGLELGGRSYVVFLCLYTAENPGSTSRITWMGEAYSERESWGAISPKTTGSNH